MILNKKIDILLNSSFSETLEKQKAQRLVYNYKLTTYHHS